MQLTEQDLAILEAYWKTELLEGDRTALEQRFIDEPEFLEEAQAMKSMIETLEHTKARTLLEGLKAQLPDLDTGTNSGNSTRYFIAAAAAAVGLVGVFVWRQVNKPELTQPIPMQTDTIPKIDTIANIDTRVIQPIPTQTGTIPKIDTIANRNTIISNNNLMAFAEASFVPPPTRGLKMQKPDRDMVALDAYDKKEYDIAIPLLKSVFEEKKDSMKLFYLSICYIAKDRPKDAIPILESMKYSNKAMDPLWYLSLSYILAGENNKAKPLLLELSKSGPPNIQEKSKIALNLMNSSSK